MSRKRTLKNGQLCTFWLDREHREVLDNFAKAMDLPDRSKALREILTQLGHGAALFPCPDEVMIMGPVKLTGDKQR